MIKPSTLAEYQIIRYIDAGKHVEECKKEWERRWGLEYPLIRSAKGIHSYKEWT